MSKINDGGPAFARPAFGDGPFGRSSTEQKGMSLRDWFAGQALAGYFACPSTPHMDADTAYEADYLYRMADAMLAARAKGGADGQ